MTTSQSACTPLLKPSEVAQRASLTTQTVWGWCRSGQLPFIKIAPHTYRIRETDLEAFLAARAERGQPPKL